MIDNPCLKKTKSDIFPRLCTVPEVCEPFFEWDDTDDRFDSARVYIARLCADGVIPFAHVEVSRSSGAVRKYWLTSSAAVLAFIAVQLRGHLPQNLINDVLRKLSQKYDVAETALKSSRDLGDEYLDHLALDGQPCITHTLYTMRNPVLFVHVEGDNAAVHPSIVEGVSEIPTDVYEALDLAIITSLRHARAFVHCVEMRFEPKSDLKVSFD